MFFFLIVYLVIILLYFLLRRHSVIPIIMILIMLVVLRNENVGSDFIGYIRLLKSGYYDISLEKIKSWFSLGSYYTDGAYGVGAIREFGFSFYLNFLYKILGNARFVINFTVIAILFIYLYAFKKIFNKEAVALCLLFYISIYLYYSSFNTLRQSFAVSFVVLGGTFLYLKRYSKAFIFFLIACSIHFTATLVVPIILIILFIHRINKRIIVILLCILILSYVLQINIFPIENMVHDEIAGRNLVKSMGEASLNYNIYIHILSAGFMAFMGYVFYWFYSRAGDEDLLFYNLWFMGIVAYILLMKSPNVGRISEYLYSFQIFSIVSTLRNLKDNDENQYVYGRQLLLLYCIVWYSFYALRNMYGLQPYDIYE